MKFKDTELLPGVVIDVADPKMLGRIKCVVPGVFDTSTMDKEGLPWIYPISMTGYQGFSKLQEGSKVWVFVQENNYREFWYMPMFEANQDTREIIKDYEEPEVIISRSAGTNSVYIYYTDKQGIMLKLGENSFINLKANGDIIAKSSNGQVEIKDNKVYIGNANASEPAVLGEKLKRLLENLSTNIGQVASSAIGQTACINPALLATQQMLDADIKSILCKDTIVS